MMAANPANLQFVVSANQLSITFSGKNPPGAGIVIVLDYSVTSGTSAPVPYVAFKRTVARDNQSTIAAALATDSYEWSDLVFQRPLQGRKSRLCLQPA